MDKEVRGQADRGRNSFKYDGFTVGDSGWLVNILKFVPENYFTARLAAAPADGAFSSFGVRLIFLWLESGVFFVCVCIVLKCSALSNGTGAGENR